MNVQPRDLYEKLEFDKIITLLEKECSGELGQAYFKTLMPEKDLKSIEKKLKEVKELKLSQEKNDKFPFNAYFPKIGRAHV